MRKEVLDYMAKIGFKVSLKWFALLIGFSLLWSIMTQEYAQLKIVIPTMIVISIFCHYVIKKVSRGWYSYYEFLYDTQQEIRKIEKMIRTTN